jgi:hypothetical protein
MPTRAATAKAIAAHCVVNFASSGRLHSISEPFTETVIPLAAALATLSATSTLAVIILDPGPGPTVHHQVSTHPCISTLMAISSTVNSGVVSSASCMRKKGALASNSVPRLKFNTHAIERWWFAHKAGMALIGTLCCVAYNTGKLSHGGVIARVHLDVVVSLLWESCHFECVCAAFNPFQKAWLCFSAVDTLCWHWMMVRFGRHAFCGFLMLMQLTFIRARVDLTCYQLH